MSYSFSYSLEKDEILRETRHIGFKDIIEAIQNGKLVADVPHAHKSQYAHQFLLLVKINRYIYVCPYVKDTKNKIYFLKTIFPSRKFTKMWMEAHHDSTKK